ncbi:MAG: EVE domain-containing protein [Paracoccus sp. (in: a-proteobacteria)]
MTQRFWIGVVSREHVLIGATGGFAMMNHGKLAPLRRLTPGDGLIYYSPKTAWPDGAPLKAFTAIGTVRDAAPYPAEMRPGMLGYRRDIDWLPAAETPISLVIDRLEFARGNWGMLARRGLFEISDADFQTIRTAMVQE